MSQYIPLAFTLLNDLFKHIYCYGIIPYLSYVFITYLTPRGGPGIVGRRYENLGKTNIICPQIPRGETFYWPSKGNTIEFDLNYNFLKIRVNLEELCNFYEIFQMHFVCLD